MPKSNKQKFSAIIEDAGGGGAFVTIPFDVEQVYEKKRVKIKALIDKEPYRGSLVRMGGPCHRLGVLKDIREMIGKTIGDKVEIVLEEDTEPRVVTIPPDLKKALKAHSKAAAFFDKLAYSHQKEYVQWIEEAKRDDTRLRRIDKMIEMLKASMKSR